MVKASPSIKFGGDASRDWSDAPSPTEKTLEEAPAGFWNLTGKKYDMEGPRTWGTSVVKLWEGSWIRRRGLGRGSRRSTNQLLGGALQGRWQ